MKKIFTLILLLSAAFAAHAQQNSYEPLADRGTFEEMVRSVVILALVYLITSFILSMIKLFLDNRLKTKIVETGTSAEVVAQLMPVGRNDKKHGLKWFSILTAIAIGLGITGFYQPAGVYMLMIMTFSLAIGFLGYFFLIRRLYN